MTSTKALLALCAGIFLVAAAPAAHAGWFSDTFQKATNTVEKVAVKGADEITKDAKSVASVTEAALRLAEASARNMCKTAIPTILQPLADVACKEGSAIAGAECNAGLDVETEGVAAPACSALGFVINNSCKGLSRIGLLQTQLLTDEVCNKI